MLQVSVTDSERLSWEALGRMRLGVGHPTLGLWTPSETTALRLEVEIQSKALAQDGGRRLGSTEKWSFREFRNQALLLQVFFCSF